MVIFGYPEIFLLTLGIIFLCILIVRTRKRTSFPTNWPLLGMLPSVLRNFYRFHEYATVVLTECGGTFEFKGPWFCNMDMLGTCDPANIHHIFSRNFPNYPKGPDFREIFEILGDGIFNADFELWELHRRTTLSFMSHNKFYTLLENNVWQKVKTGLFPVLDHHSEQGIVVDLQEIFQRFTFDNICKLVLDYDPESLCIDMPYIPCEKAFSDVVDALMFRHALPERVWKLQKWLNIGQEKKVKKAWKAFDEFIYPLIPLKETEQDEDDLNLLGAFRKAHKEMNGPSSDSRDFLRDTALSLMFAGRDTTSTCLTWLFWLIASNPLEESKIRDEIETVLNLKKDSTWRFFDVDESNKLTYLHGALCESLRLFPPVALEHKAPIQADTLPSGNHLKPYTKIIVSFYSTGRMESVWGKDFLEFKPERWISPRGGVKHEPSYKFPAFNAGPRTCLGKQMAFVQMKMIAAAIIYRYDFQVVKGHPVVPRDSIILQAKHGLKVMLSRRNV